MKWQSKMVTQVLEANKTSRIMMDNMTKNQLKIKGIWMRYQTLKTMSKTKIKATLKCRRLTMRLMLMFKINKMKKMKKIKMYHNKKMTRQMDKMPRRTMVTTVKMLMKMRKRARLNNKMTNK